MKILPNTTSPMMSGGKTDDDGAAAHLHVARALILGEQRAGERDQSVGEHQPEHHVGAGVDALRAGHVLVRAGGADGAALLRAEEPVEQRDHRGGEEQQQRQRILRQQLAHGREGAHIALGNEQVVLIHADRLIRLALHDAQVDRVERELREDTGKDGGGCRTSCEKGP